MNFGTGKIRLHIRLGGSWAKVNDVWEYASPGMIQHGVVLALNITYLSLVWHVDKKIWFNQF